jgi:hypothetical protein
MLSLIKLLFVVAIRLFRLRRDLLLENLALHHQLAILKEKRPVPRFASPDKFFWMLLRRFWPKWKQALILMQPETVVRWHGGGKPYMGCAAHPW